ncbi:MAG: hypothetical protein IJN83_05605, partial [Clostridia bacterium]|nr:hypothetical protein [Clostridia bacterium]
IDINWCIAAFWTWVAGALVFGLWMMIVKLRFYEDMQRHTASVSPRVYAIYDECCAALNVKPLTMWVVDRAISPGIAFFTYPVLLLPASMDGDEEKLRYAFLHELTHKKRRDHYMTGLLTALRVIYWFNPAVHIGFSEMRADMETACDAEVIAFVGREQKRGYLTAILELFSYATRPQLGMSQASSRRMAKQRMKGAFMRERTTFLGRAAALMLAVIMLVGCFTTACQEAPAEGYEGPVPVIGTDDWQSTVVDEINAYSSDTDYFGNTNIKANTIAINPRFFPPGTEFYIDGIGYFAGLDFLHWHGETDTKNMLSIYMDNEKQVHDFDAMYNTKVLYRMPNYEDADSPYSREYAEGMVTSQVINRLSSCSEELLNNVPTDMASNTLYDDVKKLTDTMGLFLKGVSYAEKHQRLHCNVQMVELPCSYELGRVYSAVMFALIPELYDITIGNWSYYEYYGTIYKRTDTVPPESSVGEVIAREDIAAYYAELIMKPLEEYGTSGSGIRELLSTIARVRGVNGALPGIIDIDGDGLEDTLAVDTDNTTDENFTPETAKATLTVKLGRGETITQEIPGWWQNAEYHTADFDADNRTDIALMLWVGGSNYDATNVYVYHMGNSKLTELAKNVFTNDTITYDQSRYSALNGENAPWISGGTVIKDGEKTILRLRQILDY